MEYILLSTDGPVSLYLVPSEIAENLCEYCIDFCHWVDNGPEAKRLKNGYCPEKEFINYLNGVINPEDIRKSRFIKTLEDSTEKLPKKYKDIPYFNF